MQTGILYFSGFPRFENKYFDTNDSVTSMSWLTPLNYLTFEIFYLYQQIDIFELFGLYELFHLE